LGYFSSNNRNGFAHFHYLTFLGKNFFQHTSMNGRNFRVYFVGSHFKHGFILLDFIARLFKPLQNGGLHNAFAHLGHDQFCLCHVV